jgi:hypothetical protein
VDWAIRPFEDRQDSVVRPLGSILLTSPAPDDLEASPLLRAVAERGLALTSSRCGDFGAAIELLEADEALRSAAAKLITHRFRAGELPQAFAAAAGRDSIKAVVEHEEQA